MENLGRKEKVYVKVMTEIDESGRMLPRVITWKDGRRFEIDRVRAIRQAYASSGGQGDRYTVVVNGRERYLYFERSCNIKGDVIGRWFVESNAQHINI